LPIFQQTLSDLERDVIHMNDSDQQLKKNFLELKEWQHVLEKSDQFFAGVNPLNNKWIHLHYFRELGMQPFMKLNNKRPAKRKQEWQ